MKFKLTYAALVISLTAFAQSQFMRYDSIPVFMGNSQMLFPWAGGMNFCQFSDIDLDQDGVKDLFVFDRTGNKITTYLNNGTPNQVDYSLAPQYVKQFPLLHDWALLRDYNCDGKLDIFTSSGSLTPGIAVYENISNISSGLQFQLVTSSIQTDITPNSTHQVQSLFVSAVDIPAIRDIDNDGDLDILTFDGAGVHVELHRNMSVETSGNCSSLSFRLESQCWGEFAENTLNASLTLNDSCPPPAMHLHQSQNARNSAHNGSCLECINTDGDNDQDILIGDLTSRYLAYGRNGGTPTYAKMDTVDTQYPFYDQSLDMRTFPCGYHVDVDNDGARDLIVSPNALNVSENFAGNWYYHNTGADDSVRLSYVKNDFLQSDMIEVGEGSFPRFFDYDSDGDEDLLIGNYGYYNSTGIYPGKIALYKNVGSASSPSYKFSTDDFAGIHATVSTIKAPVPAFGDIDGDGDADMIVGDALGQLSFFRKDPGPDDNFVFVQGNYMGIDVGSFATPQLVDVDRDGLLDLLIGGQNGFVRYYRNNGTASVPNLVLVSPMFGGVDVRLVGFVTGYSVPYLWNDDNGYVLLVGSERGFLFRYDNIDNNLAGTFSLTDSLYVSSVEGLRIAPWMADVDNDTLIDLVIGNYSGGVSMFKGSLINGIVGEISPEPFFSIYPNPASGTFTLSTSLPEKDLPATFRLVNVAGQEVLSKTISSSSEQIGISGIAPGLYIASVTAENGAVSHRRIVVR
jgi:hypothetical protein